MKSLTSISQLFCPALYVSCKPLDKTSCSLFCCISRVWFGLIAVSRVSRCFAKTVEFTQGRLLFVVEALRELLTVREFVELFRVEGIHSMPKALEERMSKRAIQ